MTKLGAVLLVAVFAFACGGKKKPDTTTTDPNASTSNANAGSGSATGEGVECAKEIALVCPDGQIDGCLKTPAEGTVHACVAK